MRSYVTTALDALGLLAVASGLGYAAGRLVSWAGLAVTGAVLIGGARLADWFGRPDTKARP